MQTATSPQNPWRSPLPGDLDQISLEAAALYLEQHKPESLDTISVRHQPEGKSSSVTIKGAYRVDGWTKDKQCHIAWNDDRGITKQDLDVALFSLKQWAESA